MTLDGFCDHTVIIPGLEMHQHYADLLNSADTVLYGRITYQLMEYWQTVVKNPTGVKPTDEFAVAIDRVPKIVFSNTLKNVGWDTAKLANQDIKEKVIELKQSRSHRAVDNDGSKHIFVCSPSLIVALTNLNLIDEYQLCIHPVIAGSGLPLFKNITEKITLKLLTTKTFSFGAVIHYYEPTNDNRKHT